MRPSKAMRYLPAILLSYNLLLIEKINFVEFQQCKVREKRQ